MEVKSHYRSHLSRFYSWMFGDFEEMARRQRALFEKHSIFPRTSKGQSVALDLGSGSGFQSIALYQLGFSVHAIDTSSELLDELRQRCPAVVTQEGDLRDLGFAESLGPEVIVCMGDTLTHLDTLADVEALIATAYRLLQPVGGHLVISYRDLSAPLSDLERFIPVKSDSTRILTCFLEDDGPDRVKVFDLLQERSNEGGAWELTKSFYRKLKVPLPWLRTQLEHAGFQVAVETLPSGLHVLVGCAQPV